MCLKGKYSSVFPLNWRYLKPHIKLNLHKLAFLIHFFLNALLIFEHSLPVCGVYICSAYKWGGGGVTVLSPSLSWLSKINVMLYLHIPLLLSFFSQPCHSTLITGLKYNGQLLYMYDGYSACTLSLHCLIVFSKKKRERVIKTITS